MFITNLNTRSSNICQSFVPHHLGFGHVSEGQGNVRLRIGRRYPGPRWHVLIRTEEWQQQFPTENVLAVHQYYCVV